ncbi:MAG TPA: neutral/alkaline non-lysosomal ceramidase N-terminal domain-containing protein [Acidimicrobiales bacterium]|nr:neutral/alkaline non-lysosomal ceramidase N-terminal domain-containing protein [Acidimicrobiales bacterium]
MAYVVGRGLADITGEAAECGMLGYGKAGQQTSGIHTRLRSRAFIVTDEGSGRRVLLSVNDLPMIFDSVRREVLDRLRSANGGAYDETNVLITATHTHCGPGGYSHHRLYNSNTGGFRPLTFGAIVDGIVEAIGRAEDDAAPSSLVLGHRQLHDASVNRSPSSFERNPQEDRSFFPGGIDPQSTVLGVERDGRLVGAINWFATHGTSMTNRNRLISSDNKGYAAYHWERVQHGIDYLADTPPGFIGAFAQTNAGDMSPNLHRRPGSGPTEDEFDNTRIIGERQSRAAAAAVESGARPVEGPVDSRLTYIDLARVEVGAEHTGDGRPHRTSTPFGGAGALAGTDEGPAFRLFRQGANPIWDGLSRRVFYRLSPALAEAQSPKALVVPGGLLNRLLPLAQEKVPVQLVRIGQLYLIGIPGEVTIVAGLRLRRTVASIVGAPVQDVLVVGYSNGYIHYVTTPEEYEEQRYEGGSTMFGRWELGAFQQTVARLAEAMRDGREAPAGDPPSPVSRPRPARSRSAADAAPAGRRVGDVLVEPAGPYRPGQQVRAVFVGAYPNNRLRRGGTYLLVERQAGDAWDRVADDGDWSTKLSWARRRGSVSEITVTWDIPAAVQPGTYRIRYLGDAREQDGSAALREIDSATEPFSVSAGPAAIPDGGV